MKIAGEEASLLLGRHIMIDVTSHNNTYYGIVMIDETSAQASMQCAAETLRRRRAGGVARKACGIKTESKQACCWQLRWNRLRRSPHARAAPGNFRAASSICGTTPWRSAPAGGG